MAASEVKIDIKQKLLIKLQKVVYVSRETLPC